jgi:hypothetical protein
MFILHPVVTWLFLFELIVLRAVTLVVMILLCLLLSLTHTEKGRSVALVIQEVNNLLVVDH